MVTTAPKQRLLKIGTRAHTPHMHCTQYFKYDTIINATFSFLKRHSVPSAVVSTTIQVPVSVESWNRTGPSIESTSQELSLGFLRTDNIGIWGNYIAQTYPLNQDKIWQIAIPQTTQGSCRVVIYFNEFDIEQSSNCGKDYFSVQTTKSQSDIPKYCNTLSRIEVQNRKKLQLWMHSDNTAARKGIHAIYCFSYWPATSSDMPCSCGSGSAGKRRSAYGKDLYITM